MGKIEDTIFENYKKAISQGNLEQAKRALNLASELKKLIDFEGFIDYLNPNHTAPIPSNRVFTPFYYKYNSINATILTNNRSILLTPLENKLFYLFDRKTTAKNENNIVLTKSEIKISLSGQYMSNGSIRIAILRLRTKLGDKPKDPNIIVNFYNTGYIFTGKRHIE